MKPEKVLVVEDEPLVAFAVSEDLSEQGYDVLIAPNADEAIHLLETTSDHFRHSNSFHRHRDAWVNEWPKVSGSSS